MSTECWPARTHNTQRKEERLNYGRQSPQQPYGKGLSMSMDAIVPFMSPVIRPTHVGRYRAKTALLVLISQED